MEKKKAKSTSSSKKSTAKKTTTAKKIDTKISDEVKEIKNEVALNEVKPEVVKAEKNKKLGLFFPLVLTLIIVVIASWFIKSGVFNQGAFVEGKETVKLGISNFFESILAAMSGVYQTQILFVAIVGIFYGIISRTNSYKTMVKKIANVFENKKKVFPIIVSLLFVVLASMTTQPLVLILFIPMLYAVAKELKFSKISAMLMTFGAMCVGVMGATYGGYGIDYLTQSLDHTVKDGVIYRVIIAIIGFFLLNIFIILLNKKNKDLEIVEDNFESEVEGNTKAWPMAITFIVLFVLVVLGFVAYNTVFGVEAFNNFHEWLTTKVVIGSGENEVAIFGKLLGSKAVAFGTWDLYTLSYVLVIVLIFVKIFAKIKFSDMFEYAVDGLKKMAKPMVLIVFAYALFVICYNENSPLTGNIINALNQSDKFNPFLNALNGFITSFLHVDFEYSGFLLGPIFATKYAGSANQIVAISSAMNGFASLFVPTSVFMLTGLSMSNIKYKEWLKTIWKFLLALLVVLLIIFVIISYL